ncbi:DUF4385 domain-containing protein [Kushneria phosphatilytica]|uniref:DUF4385 domain-containing protein n=1 Tax=Kushneria phosphatilytica TaxID=657387 RepID=A0A1S1NT79_9GAMM|nr:DUF4385 domain-containing protein [Kushneria phosphatilytica]OHV09980.1 cytoplasmic protein [Kushneria phosphatilytica]QEL11661.1 DUF4385 domain-containing protein [Kushneria phosphatilytica]
MSENAKKDATTDCRAHPECYRVGRGEQGVLTIEPYKSELLPHWRFRTPEIARESSRTLHDMFEQYRQDNDFVGMDMARKFIQMGYTRARRYANYRGGRKYDRQGRINERKIDETKAEAARIFEAVWKQVREDSDYLARKREHQRRYG